MRKSHEIVLKILMSLLILGGIGLIIYLALPLSHYTFGTGASATVLKIALALYDACCVAVILIGWAVVTLCVKGMPFSGKTASLLSAASFIAIISSALFCAVNLILTNWNEFCIDLFTLSRLSFAVVGFIVLAFGALLYVLASYVKTAAEMSEELEGVV